MAFSGLAARSNGDTIDETWFNQIKTEGVALEDRVALMRDGTSIPFEVYGYLRRTLNDLCVFRATQAITLQSAVLTQYAAGSSGSLQVDIKRYSGGSWTSIFTTKPAIPSSAGNLANSATGTGATAAVLDSAQTAVAAGELLRLDITAVQGGNPKHCLLTLNYKPTGS